MKKSIAGLAMTLAATWLFPARGETAFPWLTFTLTDNSEVQVPSENLKMTYSDGELHLASATVDRTLPLASLKSMRFDSTPSGAAQLKADCGAKVEVYDSAGLPIGTVSSLEEAEKSMPHGLYIIRSGETVRKVMF